MGNPTNENIESLIEAIRKSKSNDRRQRSEIQLRTLLRKQGSPLALADTIHFFYIDAEQHEICLTGDWNGWQHNTLMLERLHPRSSIYHLEQTFPIDAALPYRLVVDGRSILDPLNSMLLLGPLGTNSFFQMPGFTGVPYWKPTTDHVPRGRLIEHVAEGNANVTARTVAIYIPHDHELRGPQSFLYVNDGAEAITIGRFNTVLDNLFHYEPFVPRPIIVFVPPVDRHGEYMLNVEFAKWFANDLTKQVEKKLGVTSNASLRGIQGASLGGLFASFVGLKYSNRFRNIICQSPSYWVNDFALIAQFAKLRTLPLRFFLHTGTIKDGQEGARKMLRVLEGKGYDVTYRETNESHNWANWGGQYAAMVRWLGT